MKKDEKPVVAEALDQLKAAFDSVLAQHQRHVEAEAARRARMTPAQRDEEDRAKERQRQTAARNKLANKLGKFADAIRQHDTWTIEQFSWLLAGEDPEDPLTWGFMGSRDNDAENQHKRYKAILDSCIHTQLKPVNPSDSSKAWRFTMTSLMAVAHSKDLGCVDILAEIRKPTVASSPRTEPAPLPQLGTQSRERQRAQRRKALVEMARSIAVSGEGAVYPDRVTLTINGVELNRRFQERYPQWGRISPKTLESDRATCKPRIEVATGRPVKPERQTPSEKTP